MLAGPQRGKPQGMWHEQGMQPGAGGSGAPRLFAKSIGIGKAEQGGEGAAGRGQSLGKEESETFLLVCHWSQSKGW